MSGNCDVLTINGRTYKAVDPAGKANRAVVVVDRGWIFAGDITEENGRVYLDRAVWVFRWQTVGFAAVVEDPKKAKADIRPVAGRVDLPKDSEIFRIPVADDWGL